MLRRTARDEGAIAVISACLVLALFAIGALAVDLGNAWARKRATQNTADLAALAGAQLLPDTGLALQEAIEYVDENRPAGMGNLDAAIAINDVLADGEVDFYLDSDGDGLPDPGEITTGTTADMIRVVTPPAQVDFGLATAFGARQTSVWRPATARIGSDLELGAPPFFLTTVDSGSFCIKEATAGPNPSRIPQVAPLLAAAPTISGMSPTQGPAGTTVELSGSDFGNGQDPFSVTFGSVPVAANRKNNTSATFVVPSNASPGVYDVVVTASGPSTAMQFTVGAVAPPPSSVTLTSVTPSTSAAGSTVTLTGTGFGNGSKAFFGTEQADVLSVTGSTQMTVTAPAGTGTVPVSVSTGSTTSNPQPFTYTAVVLTSLTPSSGIAGDAVDLSGSGFTAASTVGFGTVTAIVSSRTSTTLRVTVPSPATGAGPVQVRVTDGLTSSGAVTFTYTSAAGGDPCQAVSSNRGFIDEPRQAGDQNQSLQKNIRSGIDHTLRDYRLWPVAGAPRTVATGARCDDPGYSADAVYSSKAKADKLDVNCVWWAPGSKTGQLEKGFFSPEDGEPGRMYQLCDGDDSGSTDGHSNIAGRNLFQDKYLELTTGRSVAEFQDRIMRGLPARPEDRGYLDELVLECGRFAFLPVVDPVLPPDNGKSDNVYPIVGFKGVWIDDETPDQGFIWNGGSLQGVRGYVIPLGYLPPTVAGGAGAVGPYLGPDLPKVVVLTRDPCDEAPGTPACID